MGRQGRKVYRDPVTLFWYLETDDGGRPLGLDLNASHIEAIKAAEDLCPGETIDAVSLHWFQPCQAVRPTKGVQVRVVIPQWVADEIRKVADQCRESGILHGSDVIVFNEIVRQALEAWASRRYGR